MSEYLAVDGKAAVLLPFSRTDYYEEKATAVGLYTNVKLYLTHSKKHAPFRTIILSGRKNVTDIPVKEMIIRDAHQNYTPAFTALLRDYYLYC